MALLICDIFIDERVNQFPLSLKPFSTPGESLLDRSARQHIQPILHARTFNAYDPGTGRSIRTNRTGSHTSGSRGPTQDSPFRPTRGKRRVARFGFFRYPDIFVEPTSYISIDCALLEARL